ncbi:hypothetical protein Tco_0761319 [Tanacetum coccineum]
MPGTIQGDVARLVPQWKPTGKRFNLCDIYGPRMSTEPIVTPSKFTPCVSPRTNVTLSMEPVLKPLELTQRLFSITVHCYYGLSVFLTIDSAIARLVPMGFLPSLNDEVKRSTVAGFLLLKD